MRRIALLALGCVVAGAVGLTACSDANGDGNGDGNFSLSDNLSLQILPSAVTFAAVAIGDHAEQVVTLTHAGTSGTLKLRSLRLENATADIAFSGPVVSDLQPGESTTLTVTYDPTDDLPDSGVIVVETNIAKQDGGTETHTIPIGTLDQKGRLVAASPLDFGAVEGGQTAVETITVQNIGSLGVDVTEITVRPGGSTDFSVKASPTLTYLAGPVSSFEIEIAYTPTFDPVSGTYDSAVLEIHYVSDGQPEELTVLLKGHEVSPSLVVFPDVVDFGMRAPGTTHKLPFNVSNQGELPLTITAIDVAATNPANDWSATIALEDWPGTLTLQKGEGHQLLVTFTPTADMPVFTGPVARLDIASNDPKGEGLTSVPVFGRPEAPSLQVNPPEFVDFGFVAQNLTAKRNVSMLNAGSAPLDVLSITLTPGEGALAGEWQLKPNDSWGPLASAPSAGVLDPTQSRVAEITFTNQGGDTGTAWAKLTIVSTDPEKPTWEVDLKVQRAGAPTCEVKLVPDQLDYGIVPRGFARTMVMNLEVIGSGNCSFHSALVQDCGSWAGFFGTSCDDPNNIISLNGNSDYYSIGATPPAIAEFLKPGQTYPIEITFTAPQTAPIFGDEFMDYAALFAVRVVDPYAGAGAPPKIVSSQPTTGPFGTGYPPNLHAKSGLAELSVFPQELDFGLITIGCTSQTFTITGYNVGTAPLDITNFELVGCSPEFLLKSYPALDEPDGAGGFKKTLDPGAEIKFEVAYAPQDTTEDGCSLAIYTNGADTPAAVVPLTGGGTYETEHTDEFIQTSGQDVDVLFVVDDSGSMGEEQSNLAKNFTNFINEASTWNNSYQVGVVSTDVDASGGVLQGSPRYVTNANFTAFKNNVNLGTNGSGTEQGLASAQLALSLPNIADSNVACTVSADCTAPEACVDGFCGGPNRGFLRKDAALEIVIVSDEDDQSPADLNFYINFFKNIKGFYNDNLLHVHTIVGLTGGCSSSAGDAVEGYRYRAVAQATGGNEISICEPDFADGLKSIGEIAFGLKVQFFLSRVAEPSTIEVKVNDVPCPSAGGANWSYDQLSNSVIFNENGACMPQPGQKIWIHYETICFLE